MHKHIYACMYIAPITYDSLKRNNATNQQANTEFTPSCGISKTTSKRLTEWASKRPNVCENGARLTWATNQQANSPWAELVMGKSTAKAYIYTRHCVRKLGERRRRGLLEQHEVGLGMVGESDCALCVAPAARGIWPFFSLHAQHSRSAFFRAGSNFLLLSSPITLAALTAL